MPMRRPLAALALLAPLILAACETTEGFGRDIQRAGTAIERESQEAQRR